MVVDLLAELAEGIRVNIEMQCDPRGAIRERWLFNWARLYARRIQRGEPHARLAPVRVIVFLEAALSNRFHQRFELLEVHDRSPYSQHLSIDLVELRHAEARGIATPNDLHSVRAEEPTMAEAKEPRSEEQLRRWARFLADPSAMEALAAEDPIMAEAKEALERLSADPAAQALAEARLKGQVHLQLRDQYARDEGRAEGRAEGETVGRTRALREAIVQLCKALDIDIGSHQADLEAAALDRLEVIHRHLGERRAWP